jgi:hypothetical protein
MLTSLTLPALALLISIPGLGKLPGFRAKPRPSAAAVDTLPPAWKSASRLMLENQFVFGALSMPRTDVAGIRLGADPRQVRVTVDPDSDVISVARELGQIPIGQSARQSFGTYSRDMTWQTFQRQWQERSRQSINTLAPLGTPTTSGTGIQLKLPYALPKRIQGLLGPGGPALNISGSENIRLSGLSNWSNQQLAYQGQKRSLFPSLDMQQDLDIRLEGQLSDRVRVNLLQNSGVQIPLANRIAINYKGDEDDLIQNLDLGNTSLSLPGTQYVSYSGKNEGLFGVKIASRLGPLDLTMLASKQEGRSERASYAGGASKQKQTIYDADYVKGVYFLLYDPNLGTTYDISDGSIKLYKDDGYSVDVGNMINGIGLAEADTDYVAAALGPNSEQLGLGPVSVKGNFRLLTSGADKDYEILSSIYGSAYKVIRLRQPIQVLEKAYLAVTYLRTPITIATNGTVTPTGPPEQIGEQTVTDADGQPARTMKLLWIHPSLMRTATDVPGQTRYDDSLALAPVRELELRNFYQLPGQEIDPTTLKITIHRGTAEPPETRLDLPSGATIPYVEVLGLDNFDETSSNAVPGHDEKVDSRSPLESGRPFVDTESGILYFFEPRPFAPRLDRLFDRGLADRLTRRATLESREDRENARIYENFPFQRDQDALYRIDVEFTARRATGEISLGRSNLVEGSEVITINGQQLQHDRDYTIDYDLGRVVLKKQLGAADNLNIDYSYAPLFQQAGKTLLGSAFNWEGRDRRFGGAFMYESKGAQDLRPRLGEEPSRTLIGDLNTGFTFRPDWMTRMIDRLPGVRTTTPSEMRVGAELGASLPNPNTRNEVYVDDMEGVRDAVSLSLTQERWRLSAVPSTVDSTTRPHLLNAELHWYSPYAVIKERDLKPALTDAQGGQNSHQVLSLSVPRRPRTFAAGDSMWAGLTYVLDQDGLDLSKAQFIEMWVNDWRDDRIRIPHVRMHVDLGVVSEDQQRSPDERPNGKRDTEDSNLDKQLVIAEDTGVDGIEEPGAEADSIPGGIRDLSIASGNDPEGDDYQEPDDNFKEIDPRRWQFTNGTQGNRLLVPYPDTEDLNLDGRPDFTEKYFEYTIDLGDDNHPYLATDVHREFPQVPANNGWRRYRIPVADVLRGQVGLPDLTLAKHVRIWIDGLVDPNAPPVGSDPQLPLLMIGGVEIVGSRWKLVDLDPTSLGNNTTATLNSVNSVDNADVYVAPFDPGETRQGNQGLTRREQSIALEFTGLAPNDSIEAFRSFSIDENYSRYGKLNWFVTGFDVNEAPGSPIGDSLQYFVRFATDERGEGYYEYRAPVPRAAGFRQIQWQEVKLDLTELSGLKLNPDFPVRDTVYIRARTPGSADSLVIVGRPSFTRLRRISFGLINPTSSTTYRSGQLWFNELRATDVAKDRGNAQRVTMSGQASNLLSYNFQWDGRSADFLSVGETRGSGSSSNLIGMSSTFNLHRFFEGTGIVLPVSVSYQRSLSQPRFNAGDDVVRSGAQSAASETFSEVRNYSVNYSRNWSERSNPLLRYTVGGITAGGEYGTRDNHDPNQLGKGWSGHTNVDYRVAPRKLLAIPLPWTKAKFQPLPEIFYWTYDMGQSWNQTTDRVGFGGELRQREPVQGRTAGIRFGGTTRPIESFTHQFEGVRNLMLGGSPQHAGFLYFGKVVSWNQRMSTRLSLNRGTWLNPQLNWNSQYGQDNGPQLSQDLAVRAVRNGQSVTIGWNLPFDRLAGAPAVGVVGVAAARDTTKKTVKKSGPSPFAFLLSRLGNVSTETAFNWSSSYSRLRGTPNPLYLFGLSQSSGPNGFRGSVTEDFGNVTTKAFDWKAGGRTRLALFMGAFVQTSADFSVSFANQNDVESRRDVTRFPDLQLDYGRMAQLIGLTKFLQNPAIQTSYNNSLTTEVNNGFESSRAYNSEWRPFVSIHGDLKNGTRVELVVNRRNTKNIQSQLGRSTATDRTTDVSFNLNRTYSQGQKVNLLGKETVVKSTINMGLATKYSRQSGETIRQGDARSLLPTKKDQLDVNATGSYGFSSNVTGNVLLGFGQDRNLESGIVNRRVRVELRAAFTF